MVFDKGVSLKISTMGLADGLFELRGYGTKGWPLRTSTQQASGRTNWQKLPKWSSKEAMYAFLGPPILTPCTNFI